MWHVQMRFTISMHEIEPKALHRMMTTMRLRSTKKDNNGDEGWVPHDDNNYENNYDNDGDGED